MRSGFNFFIVLAVVFAIGPAHAEGGDTLSAHRNFVSFNPIALIGGGMGANYERMFGRTGFVLEGEYTFPVLTSTGYNLTMACRFHFRASDLSGFVGPFVKLGMVQSYIVDDYRNEFRYRFRYGSAGIAIGKRGSLWARHHWLYTARFGLGYPFKKEWSWNPPPPDQINGVSVDFLKELIGIPAVIDGELTAGLGF